MVRFRRTTPGRDPPRGLSPEWEAIRAEIESINAHRARNRLPAVPASHALAPTSASTSASGSALGGTEPRSQASLSHHYDAHQDSLAVQHQVPERPQPQVEPMRSPSSPGASHPSTNAVLASERSVRSSESSSETARADDAHRPIVPQRSTSNRRFTLDMAHVPSPLTPTSMDSAPPAPTHRSDELHHAKLLPVTTSNSPLASAPSETAGSSTGPGDLTPTFVLDRANEPNQLISTSSTVATSNPGTSGQMTRQSVSSLSSVASKSSALSNSMELVSPGTSVADSMSSPRTAASMCTQLSTSSKRASTTPSLSAPIPETETPSLHHSTADSIASKGGFRFKKATRHLIVRNASQVQKTYEAHARASSRPRNRGVPKQTNNRKPQKVDPQMLAHWGIHPTLVGEVGKSHATLLMAALLEQINSVASESDLTQPGPTPSLYSLLETRLDDVEYVPDEHGLEQDVGLGLRGIAPKQNEHKEEEYQSGTSSSDSDEGESSMAPAVARARALATKLGRERAGRMWVQNRDRPTEVPSSGAIIPDAPRGIRRKLYFAWDETDTLREAPSDTHLSFEPAGASRKTLEEEVEPPPFLPELNRKRSHSTPKSLSPAAPSTPGGEGLWSLYPSRQATPAPNLSPKPNLRASSASPRLSHRERKSFSPALGDGPNAATRTSGNAWGLGVLATQNAQCAHSARTSALSRPRSAATSSPGSASGSGSAYVSLSGSERRGSKDSSPRMCGTPLGSLSESALDTLSNPSVLRGSVDRRPVHSHDAAQPLGP